MRRYRLGWRLVGLARTMLRSNGLSATVLLEDPHRSHLGETAVTESIPDCLHSPARPVLSLEDGHVVTAFHQFVGGAQTGKAGAQHDHPLSTVPVVLPDIGRWQTVHSHYRYGGRARDGA